MYCSLVAPRFLIRNPRYSLAENAVSGDAPWQRCRHVSLVQRSYIGRFQNRGRVWRQIHCGGRALELVKYKAEYNVRHFYGHEHRSTGASNVAHEPPAVFRLTALPTLMNQPFRAAVPQLRARKKAARRYYADWHHTTRAC